MTFMRTIYLNPLEKRWAYVENMLYLDRTLFIPNEVTDQAITDWLTCFLLKKFTGFRLGLINQSQ